MADGRICVCVRVRRLIERELSGCLQKHWSCSSQQLQQCDPATNQPLGSAYLFDRVYEETANNTTVYHGTVDGLVQSAMAGFNATIFAYGQTSSGKTHTMTGSSEDPGMVPRVVNQVFDTIERTPAREYLLRVSYLEIYREEVADLLGKNAAVSKGLRIHEDAQGQVYVSDLNEQCVNTAEKVMALMEQGEARRHFGVTNMNDRSSRSHTIFRIIIESRVREGVEGADSDGAVTVSHLNLVDLAGSERTRQTGATGDRLREGCAINSSLFELGNVISGLSEGAAFINYRNSKLTRILQCALGGNARTAIICTITPVAVDETHSTLRFASRAKTVHNKPHVNEVLSDAAHLRRLTREMNNLKRELDQQRQANSSNEQMQEMAQALAEQNRQNSELQQRLRALTETLVVSSSLPLTQLSQKTRSKRRMTWSGRDLIGLSLPLRPLPPTIEEGELEDNTHSIAGGQLAEERINTQHVTTRKRRAHSMDSRDCPHEQRSVAVMTVDAATQTSMSFDSDGHVTKRRRMDRRASTLFNRFSPVSKSAPLETLAEEVDEHSGVNSAADLTDNEQLQRIVDELRRRCAELENQLEIARASTVSPALSNNCSAADDESCELTGVGRDPSDAVTTPSAGGVSDSVENSEGVAVSMDGAEPVVTPSRSMTAVVTSTEFTEAVTESAQCIIESRESLVAATESVGKSSDCTEVTRTVESSCVQNDVAVDATETTVSREDDPAMGECVEDIGEESQFVGDVSAAEGHVEGLIETDKSVRDVSETEKSAGDVTTAEKSVEDFIGTENIVEDVTTEEKDVGDVTTSEKSMGDVTRTEESMEDVTIAEKSVGDVTIAEKSVGDVTTAEKSMGDITIAEKSVGDVITAEKSMGDVTRTEESMEDVTTAEKSVGDVTIAEKSVGDITTAENSLGDVTTAEKSAGDVTTAERSVGDVTTAEKGAEDVTSAEKSAGDVTTAEKSVGDITTADKSVGDVTTAEKSMEDVTTAEKSVGDVTTAEKSVGDVTTAEKSVGDVTTAEKSVGDVTEMEKSVEDVTTADKSAGDVTEMEKSVEDVTTAEKGMGDATTAEKSVGDVTTAEKSVGDVITTGKSMGDVTTAEKSMGDVTTADKSMGDVTAAEHTSVCDVVEKADSVTDETVTYNETEVVMSDKVELITESGSNFDGTESVGSSGGLPSDTSPMPNISHDDSILSVVPAIVEGKDEDVSCVSASMPPPANPASYFSPPDCSMSLLDVTVSGLSLSVCQPAAPPAPSAVSLFDELKLARQPVNQMGRLNMSVAVSLRGSAQRLDSAQVSDPACSISSNEGDCEHVSISESVLTTVSNSVNPSNEILEFSSTDTLNGSTDQTVAFSATERANCSVSLDLNASNVETSYVPAADLVRSTTSISVNSSVIESLEPPLSDSAKSPVIDTGAEPVRLGCVEESYQESSVGADEYTVLQDQLHELYSQLRRLQSRLTSEHCEQQVSDQLDGLLDRTCHLLQLGEGDTGMCHRGSQTDAGWVDASTMAALRVELQNERDVCASLRSLRVECLASNEELRHAASRAEQRCADSDNQLEALRRQLRPQEELLEQLHRVSMERDSLQRTLAEAESADAVAAALQTRLTASQQAVADSERQQRLAENQTRDLTQQLSATELQLSENRQQVFQQQQKLLQLQSELSEAKQLLVEAGEQRKEDSEQLAEARKTVAMLESTWQQLENRSGQSDTVPARQEDGVELRAARLQVVDLRDQLFLAQQQTERTCSQLQLLREESSERSSQLEFDLDEKTVLLDEARRQCQELQERVSGQEQALEQHLTSCRSQISALRLQQERLQHEHSLQLGSVREQCDSKLHDTEHQCRQSLQSAQQLQQQLRQQLAEYSQRCVSAEEQLYDVNNQIEQVKQQADRREQQLQQSADEQEAWLKRLIDESDAELAQVKEKLSATEDKHQQQLDGLKLQHNSEYQQLRQQLSEYSQRCVSAEEQLYDVNNQIEQVKQQADRREQQLQQSAQEEGAWLRKLIDESDAELAQAKEQLRVSEEKYQQQLEHLKHGNDSEYQQLRQQLAEYSQRCVSAEEQLCDVNNQIELVKQQAETREQQLQQSAQEEGAWLRKLIDESDAELAQAKTQLEESQTLYQKQMEQLKLQNNECIRELSETSDRLSACQQRLSQLQLKSAADAAAECEGERVATLKEQLVKAVTARREAERKLLNRDSPLLSENQMLNLRVESLQRVVDTLKVEQQELISGKLDQTCMVQRADRLGLDSAQPTDSAGEGIVSSALLLELQHQIKQQQKQIDSLSEQRDKYRHAAKIYKMRSLQSDRKPLAAERNEQEAGSSSTEDSHKPQRKPLAET